MTAPSYTSRTYERAAVRLHGSITYGVLSQLSHRLRMRSLLVVRRVVRQVLDMLNEDLDCTASEWCADGESVRSIAAQVGLAPSTVQGHVQRGDERRTAEDAPAQLDSGELARSAR